MIGLPEIVLIVVIVGLTVLPASRVFAKAGYPPWLGAMALVPGVNLALFFFLAFAKWPIERRLELLERATRSEQERG